MHLSLRSAATCLLLGGLFGGIAVAQVWDVDNRVLRPPAQHPGVNFGFALATGDFDGDGIVDLVVTANVWPELKDSQGAWWVYWGAEARTLTASGPHLLAALGEASLGSAVATGDFNGDGRDELAVGAPFAAQPSAAGAGAVAVWSYTSAAWVLRKTLSQNDMPGESAEASDYFGQTLAVGDFDGDGKDDLAVGSPGEDWSGHDEIGTVNVFYGSASSWLRTDTAVALRPGFFVGTSPEFFASALAAGDFDGDGYCDLAVGAPDRPVGGHSDAGAVEIYQGTSDGLDPVSWMELDDGDFPSGGVEGGELFGSALAAGEFDRSPFFCFLHPGSCRDDLAIGAPGQTLAGQAYAGKVMVAYGGASGLTTVGSSYISSTQVGVAPAYGEFFGAKLAAGRLERDIDSPDDLVIGISAFDSPAVPESGAVVLVFGSTSGLNGGPTAQWVVQHAGLGSWPEAPYDGFGAAVAVGDLDGDGWGDVVAGIPYEAGTSGGGAQVLYGALFADGLERNNTTCWSVP